MGLAIFHAIGIGDHRPLRGAESRGPSPLFLFVMIASLMLFHDTPFAQNQATVAIKQDCQPDEPDSVQISWNAPCESGTWLFDTETGCRMWDWHPEPEDTATWTGACPAGLKDGPGIVQWLEHGRPIDRFEGTYYAGRRRGFGLYVWNETDRYEGSYEDDRPHGFGTANLAGEVFGGRWKRGCLKSGEKIIAIGVARRSCANLDGPPVSADRKATIAGACPGNSLTSEPKRSFNSERP